MHSNFCLGITYFIAFKDFLRNTLDEKDISSDESSIEYNSDTNCNSNSSSIEPKRKKRKLNYKELFFALKAFGLGLQRTLT